MKPGPQFCGLVSLVALWLTAAPAFAQTPSPPPQTTPPPQPSPAPKSNFKSPDDGWFDLSGFLGKSYGFMPIAAPITEPAVGYGLAGGVAFISQPIGRDRPNITFVGGLGTENGTKGLIAGDLRYWFNRRLQTLVGTTYSSIKLNFYGIGADTALATHPERYTLEPAAVIAEAKYRLADSAVWVGVGYVFAKTIVLFETQDAEGVPDIDRSSIVSGFAPSVTFDTRDNLFTPTRGTYVEGKVSMFREALGSDDSFERYRVIGMQFVPLPRRVFVGARGEFAAASDGAPFYLLPFIYQRGVPAMRYLGERMLQAETEVRWQFWKRLSAVAFAGGGMTWNEADGRQRSASVAAGGLGARYEIARRYGIHLGADFAYGPAGHAFYVQVGSAWARP